MSRSVIVPIQLGCCPPDGPRCDLCIPTEPPTAEVIAAWLDQEDPSAIPAFFGGRPPTDAELASLGGRPFTVRVRPDLLSRADARRLVDAGCTRVELDALSFDDLAVRSVGRTHRAALVHEIRSGVQALGMQAGVVLAVGLPGSDHHRAVEDAREAGDFDTARLHPVLVLKGSALQEAHMDGTYEPLTVGQAVTTCRAMLDELELRGVRVLRIGQNPGPDGLGWAVAGPRHSSLRELVEARRALDTLTACVIPFEAGEHLIVRCAPADEGRARGPYNQHIRTLRALGPFASVDVRPDPSMQRGRYEVAAIAPTDVLDPTT